MPEDPTNLIAKATFNCVICGKEAATLELNKTESGVELSRKSFTSLLTTPVSGMALNNLTALLEAGDVRALHALDLEYAPCYCPQCGDCFCGDHWRVWDVFEEDWHDCVRGECPNGHQRLLED
jgi:hypothetical protein